MPQVTLPGGDGQPGPTITYTSTDAANLVQQIENSIFTLINEGLVTPTTFSGIQGGGSTPAFAFAADAASLPRYVLLDGDQVTYFDQANSPYINVTNAGLTIISNTLSVQTVVSGSSGGLDYVAANTGSGTTAGADVWVNGGINAFTVETGATAQFNIDGGFNQIDATHGTSTVRLYSGYARFYGANYTPTALPGSSILGVAGESTIIAGGSDASVSALDYVSGTAGGVINSLGDSSINLVDKYFGTSTVVGGATVPLGLVTINATGYANWLNAEGTSPTVNLSSGELLLTSTTPSNVVINPSGNVTIWGGLPDGKGGYAPGSGAGLLTVNPGSGSVTLFGGNSGGLIFGGAGGHNVLTAGSYSVTAPGGGIETSTLVGGGNADTLVAGSTGDNLLVASFGNTSLIGIGSHVGDEFILSQVGLGANPSMIGADRAWGSTSSDNFTLGSGSATISGDGGADLYTDYGNHATQTNATVEITDFKLGVDFLNLAAPAGGTAPSITGSTTDGTNTLVSLSDGLTIKFDNIVENDPTKFLKS